MLYMSPMKALSILLTALIVCLFAVPNFFSESTIKKLPSWARSQVVLGLDLQGGSHILLEVDDGDVRAQKLRSVQDDVRRVLREARIQLVSPPVIRGNTVEVGIRDQDYQQGLTKLRELSQPLGGVLNTGGARTADGPQAGGGLGAPPVTEPAMLEST